jgi:hypothetical protein
MERFKHARADTHRTHATSTIDQQAYADPIPLISNLRESEVLRSVRAKLQWLVLSRPDIAGSVSLLARVTLDQYKQDFSKHKMTTQPHSPLLETQCMYPDVSRYRLLGYPHSRICRRKLRLALTACQKYDL